MDIRELYTSQLFYFQLIHFIKVYRETFSTHLSSIRNAFKAILYSFKTLIFEESGLDSGALEVSSLPIQLSRLPEPVPICTSIQLSNSAVQRLAAP
jgi:hypothetical protein